MLNEILIKNILGWTSICLGLISAYYWYLSSIAKVNTPDSRYKPGVEATYPDPDEPGKEIRVFASAMEQARLSKIAAVFTAGSVVCQAISSILA